MSELKCCGVEMRCIAGGILGELDDNIDINDHDSYLKYRCELCKKELKVETYITLPYCICGFKGRCRCPCTTCPKCGKEKKPIKIEP